MISILLPVYNTEPYLPNCLESIQNQTETDWELIVVDDFSSDQSLKIINDFAKKDTRIKVYQNTTKGIIPALRLAFEKSKGAFVTRMDSDDKMMPRKLEILKYTLLKSGEGHLATACVKYFADEGLKEGYQRYEKWLNGLIKNASNFDEIYKECVIPSPNWMVYREDLIRCGAFYPDTYPEDYDLCFRFYENRLKVIGNQEVTHEWRDYSTRTSRTSKTYSNNQYFELKLPYFLKLDYNKNRPLVIWGAGRKGKKIARLLFERKIPFHWVCNNERKWNIELYGTKMTDFNCIKTLKNPQLIIAVASPDGLLEIHDFLNTNDLKLKQDYFHF
ncbi:MAG: glycosyltransferase family 2 protein [Bacteroidetes bacterium]|jgi:glycosyltransferase involved in cell wall biosynthesis|nr:glycosyltransferase family 2 protein [Bacteroidota bacterium]